ncbi:putative formate transporter [Psilocybe cubensis]|uniref:Formate transporter n=2 Tax=Psilocybe cubensis TaxID=181762 RepID=A0ACB8HCF6_PSICU|nr:putative formate transporter [Psilocybe cubensis]KAH9485458.1 putative formate transporter [Psilocybe cubensis]
MAYDTPSTMKPEEVAAFMVRAGVKKHQDRFAAVFLKAFMAGAMLSFGGLLSEVLQGGAGGLTSSNPGIVKVLGGFVFPVGLVMIVLQGQELLTSNMMVFPMALAKRAIPWWSLPVNWIIVFFGNLAGSLFFAAILVHYSGIVSVDPYATFIKTFAIHKAHDPQWHQIFLRGIGCNWLVSVAVWQAAGAKDTISKVFAIWIPIWIFVACGFDHVVANMFSVPLGIMFGAPLTVNQYIKKSLIASLIGNIIGALFVALPAVYSYLGDDQLAAAENGEMNDRSSASSHGAEKDRKE